MIAGSSAENCFLLFFPGEIVFICNSYKVRKKDEILH